MRGVVVIAAGLVLGCGQRRAEDVAAVSSRAPVVEAAPFAGGPLAYAAAHAATDGNLEAAVPAMCYTKTGGVSNPCWACHTRGQGRTGLDDSDLQETYAFSEVALENHWTNLFVDRRPFIAATPD